MKYVMDKPILFSQKILLFGDVFQLETLLNLLTEMNIPVFSVLGVLH
jgi:hypothetical protein